MSIELMDNVINEQYALLLNGLQRVYTSVIAVDIRTGTCTWLVGSEEYRKQLTDKGSVSQFIEVYLEECINPKYKEEFRAFTDVKTITRRLRNQKYLTIEFEDKKSGWMRAYCIPTDCGGNGRMSHLLFTAEPISEEVKQRNMLVKISETDSLTGIRNRYSGETLIRKRIEGRVNGVFMLLDCDKLKLVNDQYGHVMGDRLIVAIAQTLQSHFPDEVTMRLGGDEFAMYLVGNFTPRRLAEQMNELFQKVQNINILGMPNLQVTVSVGAVLYNGQADYNFEALYRLADDLLYESKKKKGCYLSVRDLASSQE